MTILHQVNNYVKPLREVPNILIILKKTKNKIKTELSLYPVAYYYESL